MLASSTSLAFALPSSRLIYGGRAGFRQRLSATMIVDDSGDDEIFLLRRELDAMRKACAEAEAQVSALQQELSALKEPHTPKRIGAERSLTDEEVAARVSKAFDAVDENHDGVL